ncbi:MAD2L1-binding protein isoform X2 [Microcaecilia unicolor]|uniref:MAD2L1-binding protein isoform X2 n=1 Tax=Microcaecilia unicolor TaxID=1415580 RepID=A0A6P7Z990_9AMPH|nr:MAD2L1-binding protein isoform X2 [Microcaecilia unicolor]
MDAADRQKDVCLQTLELTGSSDHPPVVLACRKLSGVQQSEGCCSVSVAFSGLVTQESCCRFTCELLKHVLYQRQQLPLPYDQLVYFYQRPCQQQADELFQKRWCTNLAESKKCQRILAELEQLFGHLETLFSLTLVPRVLLLLGGNTVCPRELYEVNMEGIKVGNGEQSLKTSFCMQKIFRTLFLADVFSDLQSPAIMGAMLLVQGHRDCGIDWFRPKLAYKEPSCSRRLAINLSCCDMTLAPALHEAAASTFQDYIWFQAPVTLKGFHE